MIEQERPSSFANNVDVKIDAKPVLLSLKLKLPKKGQLVGFTHEDCRILCELRINNNIVGRGYSNSFTIVCRKDQIKDEDVIVTRESRHQIKKDKDGLYAKLEGCVRNIMTETADESPNEKSSKMIEIVERVLRETQSELSRKVKLEPTEEARDNSPSAKKFKTEQKNAPESFDMEEGAKAIAMLTEPQSSSSSSSDEAESSPISDSSVLPSKEIEQVYEARQYKRNNDEQSSPALVDSTSSIF